MSYVSLTHPGQERGPHEHREQTDLFGFIFGKFELHLWVPKYNSNTTFNKYDYEVHDVGVDNPVSVIVPPGVIHGYKNVGSEPGLVFNAPNKLFAGPGKKYPIDEIRHEDAGKFKMESK